MGIKSTQYKNKLTAEQTSFGIGAAIDNAKSLLQDAILLFDNGRYERAAALAILAIEETGKLAILRTIFLEDDVIVIKKEWQNYRRHTQKNLAWILSDLVKKGARNLKDLNPIFDEKSDHGSILEDLKQLALYSDCFSSCKWSIPSESITKEISKLLLETAKGLVLKGNSAMTTTAELEIYYKHLKPVWKTDSKSMNEALVKCCNEAEDKGLIEKGTTQRMHDFLG